MDNTETTFPTTPSKRSESLPLFFPLAFGAYLVSFVLPVFIHRGRQWDQEELGSTVLMQGLFCTGWLGATITLSLNAMFWAGCICLLVRRSVAAGVLGAIPTFLAMAFALVGSDRSGAVTFGPGFYLWGTSMALLVVAAFCHRR